MNAAATDLFLGLFQLGFLLLDPLDEHLPHLVLLVLHLVQVLRALRLVRLLEVDRLVVRTDVAEAHLAEEKGSSGYSGML